MIRLVVTQNYLRGEIVRHRLYARGLSARDLGKLIGLYEANISAMLKIGESWNKNKKEVLRYAKLSDEQLELSINQLKSVLESHGVTVVDSASYFDVLVPSAIIQKLIR